MFHKELLKLYFICGTTTCQGKDLYRVVEEALKRWYNLISIP